jgi:hypothetical protein
MKPQHPINLKNMKPPHPINLKNMKHLLPMSLPMKQPPPLHMKNPSLRKNLISQGG